MKRRNWASIVITHNQEKANFSLEFGVLSSGCKLLVWGWVFCGLLGFCSVNKTTNLDFILNTCDAADTIFESVLSVGSAAFLFSHVLNCMREIPLLHCSNGSHCLNIYNFITIKCLTVIINYLMRCHKLQIQVIPSNPPQNHPP